MLRIGVIGSMVWDEIHGRDALAPTVHEWGGIAYALGALDAALPGDWEIVPIIKIGRDRAAQGAEFLRSLTHLHRDARFIEVPEMTQQVTLLYQSAERRSERMSGGVPPWTWEELGPMIADLDALYVNFISGHEMSLATAEAMRHAFNGPIYADLHSLTLGSLPDGTRILQHLPEAPTWFACFDLVQCNEDEIEQMGPSAIETISAAMACGVSLLCVTRGALGVVYVAQPGFDGLPILRGAPMAAQSIAAPVRTEALKPPLVDAIDPTGCGDVFGGTCCGRLLAGDRMMTALTAANDAAARNAAFRGARSLNHYLRGRMVLT